MMAGRLFFAWQNDRVYAGGGKKRDRSVTQGVIVVRIDGGLDVEPEDDYYSGEISPDEARKLARAILDALDAKVPPT